MGKFTIDQLAAKVIAALQDEDCALDTLKAQLDLDRRDVERAVNYLKSKEGGSRIQNVKGLLHLRPEHIPDDQLAERIIAAIDGQPDMAMKDVAALTGLTSAQVWRAVGTLKQARRIEVGFDNVVHVLRSPTAAPVENTDTDPPCVVSPDMILAALDVLPDPANPKTIATVIQQQNERIGNPFPTLGAALATALNAHQITLVGHDEEGYPLYEARPVDPDDTDPDPDLLGEDAENWPNDYDEARLAQAADAARERLAQEASDRAASAPVAPDVKTIVIGDVIYRLPYADLFPPLAFGDRASLEVSIRRFGIKKEIDVCQPDLDNDKLFDVLDGMNRLEIAARQGLTDIPRKVHAGLDAREQLDLAWSLNADRRQLTLDQRQQWAIKFRERGESLRAIAAKLHVDPKTVNGDLKKAAAAGVEFSTPDTVTGLDGKSHPTTKPAQDADAIYAQFAGQAKVAHEDITRAFPTLPSERRIKALELLKTDGRAKAVYGYPGCYQFKALPEPERLVTNFLENGQPVGGLIPGEAALKATLDELRPSDQPDRADSTIATAPSFAVGDYVAFTPGGFFTTWVGIVRMIVGTQPQVEGWNLPGDKHNIFMLDPRKVRVPSDNEYERLWTLSTRRSKEDLLCVAWKDYFITFDSVAPGINGTGHNYHPREKWDIGLAWRVSQAFIDYYIAQGGTVQVFEPEQLDARMQDIVGRAGRAKGGQIAQPPTPASAEPKGYENLVTPTVQDSTEPSEPWSFPPDFVLAVKDGSIVNVPVTDKVAWIAQDLSDKQRDMLLAVWSGTPLERSAPTRTALINRGLIENVGAGDPEAFDQVSLTDQGYSVAGYLIRMAANSLSKSAVRESADTPKPAGIEPPQGARDDSPARRLPPGVAFDRLTTPAHSDDHDPDAAAAILLRTDLDTLALDLIDAIDRFERIRSIRSLALLDPESANATNELLRVVHERARGAMNRSSELSRQLVEAINDRPTITQEEQHEPATD